jgi:hypothetical protein
MRRAAAQAKHAVGKVELPSITLPALPPASVASESIRSDDGLMNSDAENHQQPRTVANGLLTKVLPIAALTVTQAMTDKASPWAVRLQAAFRVLEIGGIGPKPEEPDAEEVGEAELVQLSSAAVRALELRRQAVDATDAEVVSGPDSVPSQP